MSDGSSKVMQYLSTTRQILSHPKALLRSSSRNVVETSEKQISTLLWCLSKNGRPSAFGNVQKLLVNVELKNSLKISAWVAESNTVFEL